jgi:hypothetical protein
MAYNVILIEWIWKEFEVVEVFIVEYCGSILNTVSYFIPHHAMLITPNFRH